MPRGAAFDLPPLAPGLALFASWKDPGLPSRFVMIRAPARLALPALAGSVVTLSFHE